MADQLKITFDQMRIQTVRTTTRINELIFQLDELYHAAKNYGKEFEKWHEKLTRSKS